MKKITPFFCALLFCMLGFAQQELLNDQNKWILHYMVINGTTINVANGPGLPMYNSGIIFYETQPSEYNYAANAGGFVSNTAFDANGPTSITSTTFTAQLPSVTLGGCSNCLLESQYLGTIMTGGFTAPRIFDYTIVDEGNGMKKLTITTPEGDIAVHGNYVLSVKKFDKKEIVMYPNPVKKVLHFDFKGFPAEKVTVFSIVGSSVLERTISPQENTLDVSFLSPGIYLMKMSFQDGDTHISRFVKE